MSSHSSSSAARFAPRHLITWLALGLGWLVAQMPYRIQMTVGRVIGVLGFYLARSRRHIAAVNLRACYPQLDARQRASLLRAHFRSLGLGVVEVAMSWWTPATRLRHLVRIEGLEHLQLALEQGRGVILLSAHFTTLEIGGRLLALYTPFHVLYREHKNPVFEAVMRRARETHFEKAIPRGDMRGFLRSLRANMPVWYAPDQNYGREHSIFVEFFGVESSTITATHKLAKISGAPVVPFFPERLPRNAGYRLRILPPLEGFPGGDVVTDTQRINDIIEAEVRRIPEQYLWVHRRFKTRPEGQADIYG